MRRTRKVAAQVLKARDILVVRGVYLTVLAIQRPPAQPLIELELEAPDQSQHTIVLDGNAKVETAIVGVAELYDLAREYVAFARF